jgi:hypothetical protein
MHRARVQRFLTNLGEARMFLPCSLLIWAGSKGDRSMYRLRTFCAAAAVALTAFAAAPALAQPSPPAYGPPGAWHHWHEGDRYFGPRHVVDWRYDRLPPPPHGYQWVRDAHQFVLLGVNTGVIAEIIVR